MRGNAFEPAGGSGANNGLAGNNGQALYGGRRSVESPASWTAETELLCPAWKRKYWVPGRLFSANNAVGLVTMVGLCLRQRLQMRSLGRPWRIFQDKEFPRGSFSPFLYHLDGPCRQRARRRASHAPRRPVPERGSISNIPKLHLRFLNSAT